MNAKEVKDFQEDIVVHSDKEGVEAVQEALGDNKEQEAKLEEQKKRFPAPPELGRFHKQPVNWQKGAGAMLHMNDTLNLREQARFHRVALSEVKKALGPRCKFLAHIKDITGNVSVEAKMDIDGTIVKFNVDMGTANPSDWEAETYKSLNDTLQKHLNNVKRG